MWASSDLSTKVSVLEAATPPVNRKTLRCVTVRQAQKQAFSEDRGRFALAPAQNVKRSAHARDLGLQYRAAGQSNGQRRIRCRTRRYRRPRRKSRLPGEA